MVLTASLAVVAYAIFVALLVLFGRLREQRTDIAPGQGQGEGRSPFAELNLYSPANYTPAGRRLLAWVRVVQLVWVGVLVWLVTRL